MKRTSLNKPHGLSRECHQWKDGVWPNCWDKCTVKWRGSNCGCRIQSVKNAVVFNAVALASLLCMMSNGNTSRDGWA